MMNHRIPRHFSVTNSDRFNYTLGRTYTRLIGISVTLDGYLDETRLARAVRLTMDAEPVLGCRLAGSKHPRWERRNDLDTRAFSVVRQVQDGGESPTGIINESLNPFEDPLFTVEVFRGSTDTILIKLEHTVADGGGAKDVLYLLADIYRRLGDNPNYRPIPNNRGDRSFRQVFFGLNLKGKRNILKPFPGASPVAVFPYRQPDRNNRAAAIRRIGPEDFLKLKAYGRSCGATINDMLLATFYRTMFQTISSDPGTPFPVNVPVDLRQFTKRKRAGAIANLTGGFYPAVIPAECGDLQQTILAVRKAMSAWKMRGIQIGRSVFSDFAGLRPELGFFRDLLEPGYGFSERTGRIVPVLTNLGILDHDRLTFGDLNPVDACFLGPAIFPPYFTACVSTYADTMTLMAGYCREPEGEQPVEEFMDRWANELKNG